MKFSILFCFCILFFYYFYRLNSCILVFIPTFLIFLEFGPCLPFSLYWFRLNFVFCCISYQECGQMVSSLLVQYLANKAELPALKNKQTKKHCLWIWIQYGTDFICRIRILLIGSDLFVGFKTYYFIKDTQYCWIIFVVENICFLIYHFFIQVLFGKWTWSCKLAISHQTHLLRTNSLALEFVLLLP